MKENYTDAEILEGALKLIQQGTYIHICCAIANSCGSNFHNIKEANLRLRVWIILMLEGNFTLGSWLRSHHHELYTQFDNERGVDLWRSYRIAWLKHLIQICKDEDATVKEKEQ